MHWQHRKINRRAAREHSVSRAALRVSSSNAQELATRRRLRFENNTRGSLLRACCRFPSKRPKMEIKPGPKIVPLENVAQRKKDC